MNLPPSILVKVATRTPGLFLAIVLETLRSRSVRFLDHRFSDGRAVLPPRYIDIKMTNRCNLSRSKSFPEACSSGRRALGL